MRQLRARTGGGCTPGEVENVGSDSSALSWSPEKAESSSTGRREELRAETVQLEAVHYCAGRAGAQ
jgi:hypothetical protein